MAFPSAARVIYEINPIMEVICQLRFTPVLKIDTEPPASFQERIRNDYPYYAAKPALLLPPGLPVELAIPIGGGQMAHQFSSKDRNWTISLTRDFLSLSCRVYTRWEIFRDHITGPFSALEEYYSPSIFVRIGLRYQDVIRRSKLGLGDTNWADLLHPWIAGAHASPDVVNDITESAHRLVIRLPENRGQVQVHHGLFNDEVAKEPCYSIDADFFTDQQTEPSHVLEQLDFFNRQSGLFFHWCIREELHKAMRPQPMGAL